MRKNFDDAHEFDLAPAEYIQHAVRLERTAAQERAAEHLRRCRARIIACQVKGDITRLPRAKCLLPVRTREQIVRRALLLSSASSCEALLTGRMLPSTFVCHLNAHDVTPSWMGSFGACVTRLGGTLGDLQAQLNRQLQSTKRSHLKESTETVLAHLECVEDSLQSLDDHVRTEIASVDGDADAMMCCAAHELCARRVENSRRWARILVATVAHTRGEILAADHAMNVVNSASGDIGELANLMCTHAKKLVGCRDACLFVGVAVSKDHGREAFYRICSPRGTEPEDSSAATSRVLGADAAIVPVESICGEAIEQLQLQWRSDKKRASAFKGRSGPGLLELGGHMSGAAGQASLLLANLSDTLGGLRALLLLGSPEQNAGCLAENSRQISDVRFQGANDLPENTHGGVNVGDGRFTKQMESKLEELSPLFALALRCPMRAAAASTEESNLAAAMESLAGRISPGQCVDLGQLVVTFGAQCRKLLDAERCSLFLFDENNNQLTTFFAEQIAPFNLSLDDHGDKSKIGIAGQSALQNITISIKDAYVDPRFNREVDTASGFTTKSMLAMPFDSCSSGALMGVCEVLNKRGICGGPGVFTDADEFMLDSILKLAALAIENCQLSKDCAMLKEQTCFALADKGIPCQSNSPYRDSWDVACVEERTSETLYTVTSGLRSDS